MKKSPNADVRRARGGVVRSAVIYRPIGKRRFLFGCLLAAAGLRVSAEDAFGSQQPSYRGQPKAHSVPSQASAKL